MHTVLMPQKAMQFQVNEDETIFKSLHQEGETLPHGCLAGSCGACIIEVSAGAKNLSPPSLVEVDTINSYLINHRRIKGEQYLEGKELRLSCRAKILGDIEFKLLDQQQS